MVDAEALMNGVIRDHLRKIRIWDYDDPDLIEYARRNYQDLFENKTDSDFFYLYQECNSNYKVQRKRLKKFPFFIYCLTLIIKDFTWDKIYFVLHKLYDNNPDSIFNFPDFSYKIKSRYKKKGIVESCLPNADLNRYLDRMSQREILKTIKLSEDTFEEIAKQLNSISKKVKQDIKLKEKIIVYIKENKNTTIRELSRKYSIKKSELLPVLYYLQEKGIISWDEESKKIHLNDNYNLKLI
jgi:hypothetical protein